MIPPSLPRHFSYSRRVLANGMRVIFRRDPEVPIACADIWVNAGVLHERPEVGGISHFFEHMFFKGTERRGQGQMDREIAALGGYNNAATSFDCTHYYVVLPAENWSRAIDILTDALLNSTFAEEEIERERLVVLEEIRRQEDDPFSKLSREFYAAMFPNFPYGNPILGTEDSLSRIGREELLNYAQERYVPRNLVLSVCGPLNEEEVFHLAETLYGDLPAAPDGDRPPPPFQSGKPREATSLTGDVQQAYLAYGATTGPIGGEAAEYALDVAASILSEGRGSRFYRRLREERGLVSSADASFSSFARAGLFSMDASCDPQDLELVEAILLEELDRVRRGDFIETELHRAKTMIIAGFTMSVERSSTVTGMLGHHEILDRIEDAVHYPDRIRSVDAQAVIEVLQTYCPFDRLTKAMLLPEEDRRT